MLNQQILEGHWRDIVGKVKQTWANLTDDELLAAEGNADQLIGLIQRKTGESRERIEAKLDEIMSRIGSYTEQAAAAVRQGAQQVAGRLHDAGERISDTARQRYAEAESLVQQRPAESIAVAFGAGLIAGIVVGLVLRSR